MDRMLYIGMSGAKERMLAQAVNNNNLANVSTVGFRADLEQARSMPVFGPGHPSRVYALTERPAVDFSGGALDVTGNPLDVAVKGEGWIAVQAPDGSEAYTRNGSLRITPDGFLVNGAGHKVMGNGGPISIPPAKTMSIGVDGTITIVPIGQAASTLAEVDRIKLVNPDPQQLVKGRDGLLRMRDADAVVNPDAGVRLETGMLERSNVNPVEVMAKMIALARGFEMQVKIMKTAEEIDRASEELVRLG